jgi:hypothetical protein
MKKKPKIQWLAEPKDHNYPSAASYLSLIYDEETAAEMVKKLRKAPIVEFKSKDIFRACGLPLMGISNSRVKSDQEKILSGEELSPILLVRDTKHGKVVIADGYHRMCAVYSFDDDAPIPCKII